MLFEDAIALATRIRNEQPTWEVIAIGRFVTLEELTRSTPWRISVNIPGFARPRMLNCENDLDELLPRPKPVAAPKPASAPAERLLF